MIKEIVDIGRVSNRLASVFTFKDLPDFYVELKLEWTNKEYLLKEISIKHLSDDIAFSEYGKELYLKYGVHKGKKSSTIYHFPSSFIFESNCDYSNLKELRNKLEIEKNNKKIKEDYEKEYKEYQKDKDKFKKQIENGKKDLINFFNEFIKNKLRNCKENVNFLLDKHCFKTKKEKNSYKKRLTDICNKKYKNKKYKLLNYLTSLYEFLLKNFDLIIDAVDDCKKSILKHSNSKSENIPIVLKIKNKEKVYYIHEKYFVFQLYENLILNTFTKPITSKKDAFCNIYPNLKASVYPKGGFYYPFSIDKSNVKYNLQYDDNLFLLSKKAFLDFMVGRTFLESYNSFYFMKLNCFVTATALNDEVLKEFQSYVKESKSNLNSLIDLIEKSFSNRNEILLNFYFYERVKTGSGKEIIEYVKDIIPSRLVRVIKLSEVLREFYQEKFNKEKFQFNWQQHIYNIYYKEKHKKFRTSLFRKIALGDYIDLERLMFIMNENMQYGINKDENNEEKYYYGTVIKHLMFLNWIDKINKGELKMSSNEKKIELFEGKSYEERLNYFLNNANLVKNSISMKIGVCVGLTLHILGWSINGYDKKILAFAGKRIERNNIASLQSFVNEIFAKTKFHEYESLHSTNIKIATKQMLNLDDNSFNKDEFIFGLFLGNELYENVKSKKDPNPSKNQNEEGDNNE